VESIYVLDNGSTDGTWEPLREYAQLDPRVVVADRDEGAFRSGMRGEVANRFLHRAVDGDWWCHLDADELYAGDPREVLSRTPTEFNLVYKASTEYFFTDVDFADYEVDPSAYVQSWTPERLRFYRAWWSEIRFVRHQRGVSLDGAWPRGVKKFRGSPERVLVRHYQYRNPAQIERRLLARIGRTEERAFRHKKVTKWNPLGSEADLMFSYRLPPGEPLRRTRVYRAGALHRDEGDGVYEIDWGALEWFNQAGRGWSVLPTAPRRCESGSAYGRTAAAMRAPADSVGRQNRPPARSVRR
jgi:glycosyltransferase involved in cell wall biosynthesis